MKIIQILNFILFMIISNCTAASFDQQLFIDHQSIAEKHLNTMSSEEMDADWKLNEFFGSIFVINLPQAQQRLEIMNKSLKTIGVEDFEVLAATDGRKDVAKHLWEKMNRNWAKIDLSTKEGQAAFDSQRQGETGCYLSHLRVIETVKERFDCAMQDLKNAEEKDDFLSATQALERAKKYSSVVILEDDNGFGIVSEDKLSVTLSTVGVLFRQAMLELPSDWDAFYFMAWSKQPEDPFSSHLVKLNRAICLNAYAIHHSMYERIIQQLRKIDDPEIDHIDPVDSELALLQKTNRFYAINPSIAYQREGLSSITSKTRECFRQTQPVYKLKKS